MPCLVSDCVHRQPSADVKSYLLGLRLRKSTLRLRVAKVLVTSTTGAFSPAPHSAIAMPAPYFGSAALRTDAQLLHESLSFGQPARDVDARVADVDDDAIGILQREDVVLDRRGQVEDEPRAIRTRPETNVFYGDLGCSVSERREQQR